MLGVGHNGDKQCDVTEWSNIQYIATGWTQNVGLDREGYIHITGYGSKRQLREINSNIEQWQDIIAVAAGGGCKGGLGDGHTVGLRKDGSAIAVGDKEFRQCETGDWTDIVAIAAGDWHTVGLKSDGTVVSTRPINNSKIKELNNNAWDVDDWTDIVAIAAGSGNTIGLKSDGTLVYAGYDDNSKSSAVDAWINIMVNKP